LKHFSSTFSYGFDLGTRNINKKFITYKEMEVTTNEKNEEKVDGRERYLEFVVLS